MNSVLHSWFQMLRYYLPEHNSSVKTILWHHTKISLSSTCPSYSFSYPYEFLDNGPNHLVTNVQPLKETKVSPISIWTQQSVLKLLTDVIFLFYHNPQETTGKLGDNICDHTNVLEIWLRKRSVTKKMLICWNSWGTNILNIWSVVTHLTQYYWVHSIKSYSTTTIT